MLRKNKGMRASAETFGIGLYCVLTIPLVLWISSWLIIPVLKTTYEVSLQSQDGLPPIYSNPFDAKVGTAFVALIMFSPLLCAWMAGFIQVVAYTAALKAGGRILGNINNDRPPFS